MNNSKAAFVEELKSRTKNFSLRAIKVFQALPATDEARIMGKQFLRSATSAAANYRAVCRSRSKAEYFSKMSIVVEEMDESLFWLEIIEESGLLPPERLKILKNEATELVKIFATARKNTV
ncbi:MAG: four helix bundle protein [Cytophagales bacterium]|jgi:four helix bundle protein|nr:four helix bundle protein [Cytophagales bacterium]